jgi:opacity protein-like surface antigen
MNKCALFLLTLSFFLKTFCNANECNTWYFGGLGGANYLYIPERHIHLRSDPIGYYVGASLGYCMNENWGVEADAIYRRSTVKVFVPNSTQSAFKCGTVNEWSYMTNIVYRFDYEDCQLFSPYMGIGIGYSDTQGIVKAKHKNEHHISFNRAYHYSYKLEKNGFLAWQAFLGLRHPLCENTELGLEARFLHEIPRTYNFALGLSLKRFI